MDFDPLNISEESRLKKEICENLDEENMQKKLQNPIL
jgi:hypothetical protein